MKYSFPAVAALALVLGACGMTQSASSEKVQSRHAGEFGCSSSEVTVETLDWSGNQMQGSFAAEGCGYRAVYVCDNGTCIRNSDAREVPTSGGMNP